MGWDKVSWTVFASGLLTMALGMSLGVASLPVHCMSSTRGRGT